MTDLAQFNFFMMDLRKIPPILLSDIELFIYDAEFADFCVVCYQPVNKENNFG